MSMAPVIARCLFLMVLMTGPMLAQTPGVAVVATTSQGRVPAVASASLTFPGDRVLEGPNALSHARVEMSGDAVPIVRDVQAFTVSGHSHTQGRPSPVVLLVLRYADEATPVVFNLRAVVSREDSVTTITPSPLSASTLTATIADVTQRVGRREAPAAIYLGVGVHVRNAAHQHVLHLVRLDTGAER